MRKRLIVIWILFLSVTAFAQNRTNNIKFELKYPKVVGDNFITNYRQFFDLGVGYDFLSKDKINIGIILNTTYLKNGPSAIDLFVVSPKLMLDYEIHFNKLKLLPQVGFGYSSWIFRSNKIHEINEYGDPTGNYTSFKENENGITFRTGVTLLKETTKRVNVYFLMAYEFTRLMKLDNGGGSSYNRNIQIVYPGIGIVWKLN